METALSILAAVFIVIVVAWGFFGNWKIRR
jgi:hypothetical protein